jgi:DNA polymerase-4
MLDEDVRSISTETTLEKDLADRETLGTVLWSLSEKVSARAKASAMGGNVVQLKLKTSTFRIITRRMTLERPTQLAHRIYETGAALLSEEATGTHYRLIGIGLSDLVPETQCDEADLIDTSGTRKGAAERAMDKVREKFGAAAIKKGRSLKADGS